ncbi:MAG: putative bifunctional diguanylate cyclase/phosphodiesterase [Devosia sp.]
MRSGTSQTRILDAYRSVSLAGAGIVTLMIILTLLTVAAASTGNPVSGYMVVATALAAIVLLALLRFGYVALRRRLAIAAKEQEAVLALAHRDALTGAFTRSYFLAQLRQMVHPRSQSATGYMQIDMDHLKMLNDANGHAAGDAALVHLIATVERLAPGAMIGRLGGDEFGIVFRGHDNKPALRRLGDQILRELGAPVQIAGRSARLSATIGVAIAPQDGVDADELISKADLALYQGKKSGRKLTVAFDGEMLADERHKRFVERELRAAILLNELELHYQPIFAADGKTLKSHESLVRWQHKVRGTIMPGEFIAIAEQSDLIDKLGDWVLRRACLDLPALGTAVGVNVSAAQLRRGDIVERFAAIFRETGVEGSQIIVEVTETVPLKAGAIEFENLKALRALGVRVAIDDFGAGYASLEYLRGFAFDIIKIDRIYVSNLTQSRVDALIVGAICDIARSLGVEVVAEGVETPEQLKALQRAGCTALQGFLLGRPEPLRQPGQSAEGVATAA